MQIQKFFFHPLAALVITILAGLFLLSLRKTAEKSQVASENVASLEQAVDNLNQQIHIENLAIQQASSSLAQEKILRNELLLQKPGEFILQIPDDDLLLQAAETTESKTPWQEWLELIF